MVGPSEILKLCRKNKIPTPDFSGNAGACASIGNEIIIYVSDQLLTPEEVVDTIIHESVHAMQAVKDYIQEEEAGREFEAYTTAYIASTLLKEYERINNAVHEEREKGLQAGVREVPLETGTTEKPLRADSGTEPEQRIWAYT